MITTTGLVFDLEQIRKIPWRRARQPTPVFLPGESHGQRRLAAYWSIGSQRDGHDWSDLASMQPHTRHKWSESCSVVSDSLWHHGLHSPWNSPGQNTGVGSFSILQGIFLTQELNLDLPHYLHADSLPAELPGKLMTRHREYKKWHGTKLCPSGQLDGRQWQIQILS